ncbi:MAG: FHA domain-containing protein [Actinomycetota bacterium]
MSELTLILLRFGLLFVLWVFVFAVVYSLRTDLFGQRVRKLPAQQPVSPAPFIASAVPAATAPRTEPVATLTAAATRLVIVSGPKSGLELPLTGEPLTIGRSSESGLVIRDDYTSTHHARLMLWDGNWVIQDLDSTNGTFLDGNRVTLPTPVPPNTPIRIGTTSFELRR